MRASQIDKAVDPNIRNRWSPHAFSNKKIGSQLLAVLFEAARSSPSCMNEQPWRFLYFEKDNSIEYQNMLDCLVAQNRKWANKAPVLILGVYKKNFTDGSTMNNHGSYDLGQAVANLTIQALIKNLYLHQMAGFDHVKAQKVFQIPEDYSPHVSIALGYLADASTLSSQTLRERELIVSSRKKTSEIVFNKKWPIT